MALAYAVDHFGIAALVRIHPGLTEGAYWRKSVEFYDRWGLLLAFAVSLTPLPQQPPIVLAGMAQAPLPGLGLALLGGRLIKYLILSFVGSHAPRMLGNLWGVQKELEKAGVHVDIPGKASHKD
jgi:membrane protein YqaA with SNARE-associated domain